MRGSRILGCSWQRRFVQAASRTKKMKQRKRERPLRSARSSGGVSGAGGGSLTTEMRKPASVKARGHGVQWAVPIGQDGRFAVEGVFIGPLRDGEVVGIEVGQLEDGRMVHGQKEASTRSEDTPHLGERGRPVRQVVQHERC